MKHLFLTLALIFFAGISVMAQTDSISEAYSRIKLLEQQLQQQNSQISKLSADVNEVLKQNLALKKNLNLQPTRAKAKAGDSMEYRIIEVKGDPITKDVHVIMTADNIGTMDKDLMYWLTEIIDETGNAYNNDGRCEIKIDGIADNVKRKYVVKHHPNAPYTIDTLIKGYNPNAQYIKYLNFDITDNSKHIFATFENLPIKWTEE